MTPGWLRKKARKEPEGNNTGLEDAVPVLADGLDYEVDPVGAIFRVFTLACIAARRVALRGLTNAVPEGDPSISLNGACSLQLTPYTMLVVAHAVQRTEQELRSLSASPCSSRAISRQGSTSELEGGLDGADAAPAVKALQVATAPPPATHLSPSSSSCSLPQTPRQQQKAPRAPTPCSPRSLASTRPTSLYAEPQSSSLADRTVSANFSTAQVSTLAAPPPAVHISDPNATILAATTPPASLPSQLHMTALAAPPPTCPVLQPQVSRPMVESAPAAPSPQPQASPLAAPPTSCLDVVQTSFLATLPTALHFAEPHGRALAASQLTPSAAASLCSTTESISLAATAPASPLPLPHGGTVGATPAVAFSSGSPCETLAELTLPPYHHPISPPHMKSAECSPPAALVAAPQASTLLPSGKCDVSAATASSSCTSSVGSNGIATLSSSGGANSGASSESSRGPRTAEQNCCGPAQRLPRVAEEQPAVQPAAPRRKAARALPACPAGLLSLAHAAPHRAAARQRLSPTPSQSPSPPALGLQLQEEEGKACLVSCNKDSIEVAGGLPSRGCNGRSSASDREGRSTSRAIQWLGAAAAIAALDNRIGACSGASAAASLERLALATVDKPVMLRMVRPGLAAREGNRLAEGGRVVALKTSETAAGAATAAAPLAAVGTPAVVGAADTSGSECSRDSGSPSTVAVHAAPGPAVQAVPRLEGGELSGSIDSGAGDSAAGSPAGEPAAEHQALAGGRAGSNSQGQQCFQQSRRQQQEEEEQQQQRAPQQRQRQQQPSVQEGDLWQQSLRELKQSHQPRGQQEQQQQQQREQQKASLQQGDVLQQSLWELKQQQRQQQPSRQQGDMWRQSLRVKQQHQQEPQHRPSRQEGAVWRHGLRVLKRALVVGAAMVVLTDGATADQAAAGRSGRSRHSMRSWQSSDGAQRKDLSPYAVLAWGPAGPAWQQHLPYFQVVQQQHQLQRAAFLTRAYDSAQGRAMVPAGSALPARLLQQA